MNTRYGGERKSIAKCTEKDYLGYFQELRNTTAGKRRKLFTNRIGKIDRPGVVPRKLG